MSTLSLPQICSLSAVASLVSVWVAMAWATGEGLGATSAAFVNLPTVGWAVIAIRILLVGPEEMQDLSYCGGKEQQTGSGSCSAGTVAYGPRRQGNIQLNVLVLPSLPSETMLLVSLLCFINSSNSNALFSSYI